MLPKLEKSHGYELQFFTNHIGHFMLVTGLLEQLKDEGRVVMLSSEGHRRAPVGAIEFDNLSGDKGYQPLAAYGQSKIANLLFAKELQRRFAGAKKIAYAVHPGVVDTNLARNLGPVLSRVLAAIGPLFLKSVRRGRRDRGLRRSEPEGSAPGGQLPRRLEREEAPRRCRRRRARHPAVGGVREDRSGALKTKPLRVGDSKHFF